MTRNTEYWIDTSLYDLEVARSLLEKEHYLYVAFLCHQCVEKMLKALFVHRTKSFPPKIHNLVRLSEMTEIRSTMSDDQILFLAELDPMNIEARYPTYKENIRNALTRQEAINIIDMTEAFAKWVKSIIS